MGRKLALSVLSLLLVALVAPILHVKAHEGVTLELTTNKEFYYLKGEPLIINAWGNSSVAVTLSVYWNWQTLDDNELIYRNTKTLNASWTLPTAAQKPGFYRIEANTSETTVTIWRTLIHVTGYQVAALPFSHVWKGINYTLDGRMFKAETPDDFIEITYPKIPFLHNTRFYYNNMTFLVRLDGNGWAVDLVYMTLQGGLKWRINGTLDNPVSFEFECSHNPLKAWKQRLDRFQSDGYLVFDWGDLRKAGKAFSWDAETKTLTVNIPSSFDLDPYLFEDGFESGDFGAWTGTGGTPTIDTDPVHHGDYSCFINDEIDLVEKTFSSQSRLNMRAYINFATLPSSGTYALFLDFYGDSHSDPCAVVRNTSGTVYWAVRDSDGTITNAASGPSTGQWYCVELEAGATSKKVELYVNGASVVSHTASVTDTWSRAYLGTEVSAGVSIEYNGDCCVIDTAYIGPEVSGQDLTFTLAQNITVFSSLSRTIELQRYMIANPSMLSSLTVNKERPFTLTGTASFYSSLAKGVEVGKLFGEAVKPIAHLATAFEVSVLDLYFTLSEVIQPLSPFTARRELGKLLAGTVTFSSLLVRGVEAGKLLSKIIQPLTSILSGKELTRTLHGNIEILHSLGTAPEGVALELTVILFETVRASTYVATTIVSILTIEMVYAVAALAFILAIVAVALVVVQRNRD